MILSVVTLSGNPLTLGFRTIENACPDVGVGKIPCTGRTDAEDDPAVAKVAIVP